MIKQTHTLATLEVSESTFNEIKKLLLDAGYDHVFLDNEEIIDMQGIGIKKLEISK
jgi:hypothetical protein